MRCERAIWWGGYSRGEKQLTSFTDLRGVLSKCADFSIPSSLKPSANMSVYKAPLPVWPGRHQNRPARVIVLCRRHIPLYDLAF
jgi:hypothetical protein